MTPAQVMQGEPDIVLRIPRPPSANELWTIVRDPRGRPRLAKSTVYKAWLFHAGLKVNLQTAGDSIPGAYAQRIVVPDGLDADNHAKAAGDLLQAVRVVKNDKHCRRLVIDRDDAMQADATRIELWRLDA